MKPVISIFILLLSALFVNGQNDKHNWPQIIHIQDSIDANWERQMDSLSHVFYSKPKYFDIKLEINGKQKRIKNESFIVSIDQKEIKINPDSGGKYLMTFEIDSCETIILKLISKHVDIEDTLKGRESEFIKAGATLTFGLINDIYRQSRRGLKKPKDEDYGPSQSDELYNDLLSNERVKAWIRKKQIKSISYIHIRPRVFGCGTEWETVLIK